MVEKQYSIGEFAAVNKITPRMLRHYDKIGLLNPAAVLENGYRAYTSAQIQIVLSIRLYQSCGFTLAEVRRLLDADEADVQRAAKTKLAELDLQDKTQTITALAWPWPTTECCAMLRKRGIRSRHLFWSDIFLMQRIQPIRHNTSHKFSSGLHLDIDTVLRCKLFYDTKRSVTIHKIVLCALFAASIIGLTACGAPAEKPIPKEGATVMQSDYRFPSEESLHEGTWLTWPHHHTYGMEYREEVEGIWLEMAFALHTGELLHIIAYDETEQRRITKLLQAEGMDMSRVDFVITKSDDVWSRDTGPMFVLDENGKLSIVDFAFDGWGGKTPYQKDDQIPQMVAAEKNIPILSIPDFVLEGGSVELDGSGTAMLCKSSVVSESRNPKLSVKQAEEYLARYLGATNFIWLEGVAGEDITDAHIDGMARFYDTKTLLTVSEEDFFELYEGILESDYETLRSAKNAEGEPYEIIELPMTAKHVDGLDYKGSYLNYYVGNEVVLVPVYGDANDAIATEMLSQLYSTREIVPIDVTALYQYGGMLHCVTQQQPKEEID